VFYYNYIALYDFMLKLLYISTVTNTFYQPIMECYKLYSPINNIIDGILINCNVDEHNKLLSAHSWALNIHNLINLYLAFLSQSDK